MLVPGILLWLFSSNKLWYEEIRRIRDLFVQEENPRSSFIHTNMCTLGGCVGFHFQLNRAGRKPKYTSRKPNL